MKDVPVLCNRPMDDSDLWPSKGQPNYKLIQEHMLREGPVTKKQVIDILKTFNAIVSKEPNMI